MSEEKTPSAFKRYALYSAFFMTCFVVSAYLTFPMHKLKPRVEAMLLKQLQQSGPRPGRFGTPARLSIGDMQLYHLSGLELRHLSLRTASTDPDPNPDWNIDAARVRLELLPLLTGSKVLGFDVDAYDGNVSGKLTLVKQKPGAIEAELRGINMGKIPPIVQALGVPFAGQLNGDIDLKLGKTPKEAKGKIQFNGKGYNLGPGEIKIPGLSGGLTVPLVRMGKLDIKVNIADGKAKVWPAQLVGQDLQLRAKLNVNLRTQLNRSIAKGGFVLKLDEQFLKSNDKFQPILDFTPQLKRAKTKDGAYAYKINGMLSRLRPRPDSKFKVD